MTHNRSVPVDTVIPHITYRNVAAAIDWLTRILGFVEHFRYGEAPDGTIAGAQMQLGRAYIMLTSARAGRTSPLEAGVNTQFVTIFVADVNAHYARTMAAGATIFEPLNESIYGELQYGVTDLEGHSWIFSQHIRDISPDEWGAKLATK